ncbi:hypothetical protein C0993_011965 [Termitomyces sp. T159_Od127]|nr:hypothetical protein C0993_011965 [Termitomyces sp. T159_Od127]
MPAIALSLKEANRNREVIEIEDDIVDVEEARFQAELQEALAVSRAESSNRADSARSASGSRQNTTDNQSDMHSEPSTQLSIDSSATGLSEFLLQRAQMERERLARQKRLRPDAITTIDNEDDEDDEELQGPPTKRQHISHSCGVRVSNDDASSSSQRGVEAPRQASANVSAIDELFWNGELRQTATQHGEPRKDGKPTFRLTEVLGKKSDLAFAIISSYSLDLPWIYGFFDLSVPVVVIAQPDASGEASLKYVFPNWIRTTPFLRGGRGCMHMKFMLLFYKTGRLRVVVSTANLIAYDYRDMENVFIFLMSADLNSLDPRQTIWLQDIPQQKETIKHDSKASQDFPTVLQGVLHSLHVQPALRTVIIDNHPDLPIKSIDELGTRWDWSKVKVHLVPSISGKHEGWPAVIKTGHPRLMQVVRNMGLRTGKGKTAKDITLECQVCPRRSLKIMRLFTRRKRDRVLVSTQGIGLTNFTGRHGASQLRIG